MDTFCQLLKVSGRDHSGQFWDLSHSPVSPVPRSSPPIAIGVQMTASPGSAGTKQPTWGLFPMPGCPALSWL